MSLRPQPVPPVPDETVHVARAAFPSSNIFILLRDEIGTLATDEDFNALFPTHGQSAEAPWRLALVTIFQFIEGLSERAAADAVRSRIDWKYALSLELTDSGFDSSVLCEFRARLLEGNAEQLLFDKLLAVCRERKWLKRRGRQRTDSTHVIAAVQASNRLQGAIETLRHALNSLAVVALEWLRAHAHPEWQERYAPRAFDHYIPPKKRSGKLMLNWLELTATCYSPPSQPRTRHSGCAKCQWARRCAEYGCSSTIRKMVSCTGAQRKKGNYLLDTRTH